MHFAEHIWGGGNVRVTVKVQIQKLSELGKARGKGPKCVVAHVQVTQVAELANAGRDLGKHVPSQIELRQARQILDLVR